MSTKVLSSGRVLLFFKKSSKNFKKTVDKCNKAVYNITAKQRKEAFKMILKFAIQTVFEILLVVGIIYGFIKEDKLIAFEDKIKASIKNRRR